MLLFEIFMVLAVSERQGSGQVVACSYFNAADHSAYAGRCTLRPGPTDVQPYVETIEAGGERFEIAYLERQGRWARITINGRSGMRYEINREQFAYTTDDLEISLTQGD